MQNSNQTTKQNQSLPRHYYYYLLICYEFQIYNIDQL
jgi:hypothetical protein